MLPVLQNPAFCQPSHDFDLSRQEETSREHIIIITHAVVCRSYKHAWADRGSQTSIYFITGCNDFIWDILLQIYVIMIGEYLPICVVANCHARETGRFKTNLISTQVKILVVIDIGI